MQEQTPKQTSGEIDILPRAIEGEALPLSHAQEQLWFLQAMEPALTAYNLPRVLRLSGALDADALERAFRALIRRHAVLRTRFGLSEGRPAQWIQPDAPFRLERLDLSAHDAASQARQLDAAIRRTVLHVFDLGAAPPLVARLITLEQGQEGKEGRHVLVVCLHHIVSDGWSNQILVRDLAHAYRLALADDGDVHLPPLPLQYADHVLWQRHCEEQGAFERHAEYWNAYLDREPPPLDLRAGPGRRAARSFDGAAMHFGIPSALVQSLRAFCKAERCTPFVALLAAWQVLLARYSGQDAFAIGVPHAGRQREETHELLGFFVGTQIYKSRVRPHASLRALCRQVRADALAAMEHADVSPVMMLTRRRGAGEGSGGSDAAHLSPFQVMFGLQTEDAPVELRLDGVEVAFEDIEEHSAKCDLALDVQVGARGVFGRLEYSTDLFDARGIERLASHYLRVLELLAAQPDMLIAQVQLPDEAEHAQLLALGRNDTRYRSAEPVHVLIDSQAAETPEATALLCEGRSLSYAQLRARTDALAHALIALGAGTETRTGIALERSLDMAVGVLAVLKAGGTYVPLDPEYPRERLSWMVQDSGVSLILTHAHLRENFAGLSAHAQVLDIACLPTTGDTASSKPALHDHSLAYIIYTSGSTGRPKGIGISHAALAEQSRIAAGCFGLSGQDRMLQFSTINFDGFVEQLFPALTCGATVVLRGPQLWDSERFYREALDQGITIADLPAAYWHLLAQDYARQGIRSLGRLRQINASGEAMPLEGIKAWRQAGLTRIKLLNIYGPTETVVSATAHDCTALLEADDPEAHSVPIGRPLAGRSLHILGPDLEPVPQGIAGELYIGGELLARGYHDRPGLSAERFIADPCGQPGGRLYRTGDLVRWNENGELQYLGRTDHQVKVRGFRIELGEIEARLLAQQGVREAAVIARETGTGTRLLAYVSAQEGHALQGSQLRQSLAKDMPDYMIPSSITVLPTLPVNGSGKLDRNALPDVQEGQNGQENGYASPQGELESAVARIWQDVLGIERIGRDDNFFELGGHSLLALKVIAGIQASRCFHSPPTLYDLMQAPTIQGLCARLDRGLFGDPLVALNAYLSQGPLPLFCIHSGFGTALGYLALARQLNGRRTVYGISCRALNDPSCRPASLQEIADDYAAMIRSARPQGPYLLLGWSLGGALAAMVTARLEAAGEQVAFLGLVDPYVPDREEPSVPMTEWRDAFGEFLREVAPALLEEELAALPGLPDPLESEAPLVQVVGQWLTDGRLQPDERYAGASALEIVRLFIASRILERATLNAGTTPFQRLHSTPVHGWWSRKGRRPERTADLAERLGCAVEHTLVDTAHDAMMTAPDVLRGVQSCLDALEYPEFSWGDQQISS